MDNDPFFECECPEDFGGYRCQYPNFCSPNPCREDINECVNLPDQAECLCKPGIFEVPPDCGRSVDMTTESNLSITEATNTAPDTGSTQFIIETTATKETNEPVSSPQILNTVTNPETEETSESPSPEISTNDYVTIIIVAVALIVAVGLLCICIVTICYRSKMACFRQRNNIETTPPVVYDYIFEDAYSYLEEVDDRPQPAQPNTNPPTQIPNYLVLDGEQYRQNLSQYEVYRDESYKTVLPSNAVYSNQGISPSLLDAEQYTSYSF